MPTINQPEPSPSPSPVPVVPVFMDKRSQLLTFASSIETDNEGHMDTAITVGNLVDTLRAIAVIQLCEADE